MIVIVFSVMMMAAFYVAVIFLVYKVARYIRAREERSASLFIDSLGREDRDVNTEGVEIRDKFDSKLHR